MKGRAAAPPAPSSSSEGGIVVAGEPLADPERLARLEPALDG